MTQEEIDRLGEKLFVDAARPLIDELAERLGLDLEAEDELGLRLLVDYGRRLFATGFTFGTTNAGVEMLKRDPEIHVVASTRPDYYEGPLGEIPGW